MSRTIRVMTFAVLVAGLAAPAHAGQEGDTVSRYCSDHHDFGLSHGACVAQFTTGNTTPHNADICKLDWVRILLGAENEGECVTALGAISR